jgi:hypothetical protein
VLVGVTDAVGVGVEVLVGVNVGVGVSVGVSVFVAVFVGVTDGGPTCIIIELAFAPEPQLQVYVPGVAPIVAKVVELNVVVPLMNEPEVYPDGTNKPLIDEATKVTPKKSPVPELPIV